jgi:hypothetical protein
MRKNVTGYIIEEDLISIYVQDSKDTTNERLVELNTISSYLKKEGLLKKNGLKINVYDYFDDNDVNDIMNMLTDYINTYEQLYQLN